MTEICPLKLFYPPDYYQLFLYPKRISSHAAVTRPIHQLSLLLLPLPLGKIFFVHKKPTVVQTAFCFPALLKKAIMIQANLIKDLNRCAYYR